MRTLIKNGTVVTAGDTNRTDVLIEGDDILGDGVNIAARLESIAEPGGICISRTVRDHIRDRLA